MVKDVKVTMDERIYSEFEVHYPLALNDSERIRMALNTALTEKRLSVIEAMDFDESNHDLDSVLDQLQKLNAAAETSES